MKTSVLATVIGLSVIACPLLYIFVGPALDPVQLDILRVLLIITGCSAAYCFVVGEITRNNSQMDKLWSILPAVYVWVIAAMSAKEQGVIAGAEPAMQPRLVVMAILATLWGIRLTFNFGRKGAYKLKFWEGEEDYRWVYLRSRKEFQPRWKWAIFNFFFISIYQNVLVLMITFPALVAVRSVAPFGWVDALAAVLMLGFLVYETIADEQQWKFQTRKWAMIKEGRKLQDLPSPYNLGFNTTGLWSRSRHPNYFAEQGIWVSFYIFSIGAGIGIINWSMIGALLLIVLFLGSSTFGEGISSPKYPLYKDYQEKVSRFFPGKKYIA